MVGAKHFLAGVAQGRMTQVMEQGCRIENASMKFQ
jgi:hypothetical protein